MVVLLASFGICSAQEISATLTGTVTDVSGGVIAGASVVVHNDSTDADVRTVTTDSSGGFTVTICPPVLTR